jgi:hypothetical protein
MPDSVYAVFSICCIQCYFISQEWWDGERWLNFIFRGDGSVEDQTERNESRWGISSKETGTWRISYTSQFTIPRTTRTRTNQTCNNSDSMSATPNKVSCTPCISYLLISSKLLSSSSSASLFLVHNSTIIADHKVKSSLSLSPCHHHALTLSTAYTEYSIHQVQHMPSTAYTKYSIHQVQHTPSTASTPHCLSSLHSGVYTLTPECRICF